MTQYVTKRSIPDQPRLCIMALCVYNREGGGICSDPRTNRGNSDALCYRVLPRIVLGWLTTINKDTDEKR